LWLIDAHSLMMPHTHWLILCYYARRPRTAAFDEHETS
jgi:hypothetical protein